MYSRWCSLITLNQKNFFNGAKSNNWEKIKRFGDNQIGTFECYAEKKVFFHSIILFFIIKSVFLICTLFRWPFGKKADRSCDERLDHPNERLYNIQKKNQWSRLCVHVQGERVGLLHLQVTKQCYDAHLLSHHFTYVFDKFNRLSISHWSVVIVIFSGWIINFN